MKQLYYAIQTILHGRGSNVTKVISLSLGLTIGILLFSQIAFELSYEKCYPDAERLALARELFIDSKSGKIVGDDGDNYDYTLFAPTAAALAENLPEQIKVPLAFIPIMPGIYIKRTNCWIMLNTYWQILVFSRL